MYRLSDIKAELFSIKKEKEHFLASLEREKNSYDRFGIEIENKERDRDMNKERSASFLETSESLKEKNKEFSSFLEGIVDETVGKKSHKDSLSRVIQSLENTLKLKSDKLETLRNNSRDLELKKQELDYTVRSIVERMIEAYKTDVLLAEINFDEPFNRDETEKEIALMKSKLGDMGEVSLGAVEEHKELQERYNFLSKQKEDIVKSREDIMKAITDINRTTRKMFSETFEAIKQEFDVYFKMLFNGGKADLILEDENDILESGIEIVVRPPGKTLQSIMLLSGGEKAMTAIALIFAIFKVNPSPFCILDEIDAPLDESNVVRFCKVLKEFLKLSQFVIVTHNRMTIQLADILYGITMEEKGVSKIVSVKFNDEFAETLTNQTVPATK
ncbi:chromosome segregation protein SMC [Candidatus Omnitrophus magneticus]|uniref:Chromosome segregation protein SMC n=1 Tax=Candidatus Omnitrophus magneticus TaxID=1609969 RepID=A0A0F0CQB5_9BACT|nr:chromosome segregation protein SMC [Candidatus Omnitrophus magneticus]